MRGISPVRDMGRVCAVEGNLVRAEGLATVAAVGDRMQIRKRDGRMVTGEAVQLRDPEVAILPDSGLEGLAIGDRVELFAPPDIVPSDGWLGRVIDPDAVPLDGRPLLPGSVPPMSRTDAPPAMSRKPLGARLETGLFAIDTLLPIVRGQRVGLFAGSGVGKTRLLADLATGIECDVVVIALIGERGRELREFVEQTLGVNGMKRAIVVAATSDQSPLVRRRCAATAMRIAEHFRDAGRHVLFLADSITRLAESHREVALAAGELPALRGHPPSVAHRIAALCERAGPGVEGCGDITAVFTVLVAGSNLEEPVADILRGVLDGHIVLSRDIAERGRFPAIDISRSVSRSLPGCADDRENALISQVRRLLGAHDASAAMIRAGLYAAGNDPVLDQAMRAWDDLDTFFQEKGEIGRAFDRLDLILRKSAASK
nr:FliI/YscN family ATPase [Shimia biformata]